jgi:hypothetical protein
VNNRVARGGVGGGGGGGGGGGVDVARKSACPGDKRAVKIGDARITKAKSADNKKKRRGHVGECDSIEESRRLYLSGGSHSRGGQHQGCNNSKGSVERQGHCRGRRSLDSPRERERERESELAAQPTKYRPVNQAAARTERRARRAVLPRF